MLLGLSVSNKICLFPRALINICNITVEKYRFHIHRGLLSFINNTSISLQYLIFIIACVIHIFLFNQIAIMSTSFDHRNRQDIFLCGIRWHFHREASVFWTAYLIALALNQKTSGKVNPCCSTKSESFCFLSFLPL